MNYMRYIKELSKSKSGRDYIFKLLWYCYQKEDIRALNYIKFCAFVARIDSKLKVRIAQKASEYINLLEKKKGKN